MLRIQITVLPYGKGLLLEVHVCLDNRHGPNESIPHIRDYWRLNKRCATEKKKKTLQRDVSEQESVKIQHKLIIQLICQCHSDSVDSSRSTKAFWENPTQITRDLDSRAYVPPQVMMNFLALHNPKYSRHYPIILCDHIHFLF